MYLLEGRQWACLYHLRLLTVLSNYNRVRKRHACVVWRVSKEPTGRSMGRCSRLLRSQCDVCWLRLRALAGRCSPSAKRSICFVSGRNARGGGDHRHTLLTASIFPFVCSFHYALSYQLRCNRCTSHRHTSYTTQLSTYEYGYAVIQHTNIQLHANQQMLFFFSPRKEKQPKTTPVSLV